LGSHAVPVKRMIPQLRRIVKKGSLVILLGHDDQVFELEIIVFGTLTNDYFLQGQVEYSFTFYQLVGLVQIRLVVTTKVKLKSPGRNCRSQSTLEIRGIIERIDSPANYLCRLKRIFSALTTFNRQEEQYRSRGTERSCACCERPLPHGDGTRALAGRVIKQMA